VLACAGGVGWTITTYSARLGAVAIVGGLTAVFAATLYYCFSRTRAYSRQQVDAPGLAFDYVLYLGCLIFAVELGYIESQFHPFGASWDHSLLVAAAVFFVLAYRFDNRLVLSLALSSLGAWFGVRLSRFNMFLPWTVRPYALAYGTLVAVAGGTLHRAGIKRHFLDTYLHVAAIVLFTALASGVATDDWMFYVLALGALAAFAIVQGVRFRRFAFVVYGVVYSYAAVTTRVLRNAHSFNGVLAYFVISGSLVIVALVVMARRVGRDA